MIARPVRALSFLLALALPLGAQENSPTGSGSDWDPHAILRAEGYVRPPANLERMILAPRVDISFDAPSPDRSWFLRTTGPTRGDILARGKEHLYIAGFEVDTRAHRARSLTTSNARGLALVNPKSGATRTIATPAGAAISSATWSPDGKQVAYIASFDAASHAYVADVATGRSTQLTRTPLMPMLVEDIAFTADGRHLVVTLPPDGRRATPPTHGPNNIEDGPTIRFSDSIPRPQRVYASLLLDRHDVDVLRHYTTTQLALIDVRSRAVTKVGAPKIISEVAASADGSYFTVTYVTEPFSYDVPLRSFGTRRELWDRNGRVIATLGTTPLRDRGDVFSGGAAAAASDTGKRNIEWNPAGAGLLYHESVFAPAPESAREARAGSTSQRRQPTSVRLVRWVPPFGPNDTTVLYEGGPRLGATIFADDGTVLFAADSGTVFAVRLADGKRFNLGRRVTLSRTGRGTGGGGGGRGAAGAQDADTTALGGAIQTRTLPGGGTVVVLGSDGKSVVVTGTRTPGAEWSTKAPRPWADRLDIETAQRTRLLDSPADFHESLVGPLDDDFSEYLYARESRTTIQDVWLRDLASNATRKVTNNVDVGPEVTGAQRKRFRVKRPRDGNTMWVDVTLPRDWRPGQRLPSVLWFYPREYASQEAYERSRYSTNINEFPAVPSLRPASSIELWVSQGYALIEPDFPIWGDSGRMNDNFIRDLRENLDAIVDAVIDSGFTDREHLGIGGHSYGAFATVNAMTLVPYFKAGIAGDGMYNRTLTPFGFQSERRSLFDAQAMYLEMSPFLRADKLAGALLMYHNWEDQNVGTHIISSQRMMAALQGLGKTAALYMYPYEDHSVAAYASDLDQWARWIAWFDIHVKRAGPKPLP